MRIHHIALSVRDLGESVSFYKRFFSFTESKRFERKDLGGKAVFLKLGETHIELWQFEEQIENKDDLSDLRVLGIRHVAFEVEDIEKKYEELKSKIDISKPRMGASGSKYCFLKDPNGIPIELYEKQ